LVAELAVQPVQVVRTVHAVHTAGAGAGAVLAKRGDAADHVGVADEVRPARIAEQVPPVLALFDSSIEKSPTEPGTLICSSCGFAAIRTFTLCSFHEAASGKLC